MLFHAILFYCFVRWCITSDSTGRYLAVGVNYGPIYTSSNYGVTWSGSGAGSNSWYESYYIIALLMCKY